MNIKQLEYIIAISEEKNILRASEKLYITQSTLSQSLLNLEKELGTPLFIRNQRNMVLTEAGEHYVEGAKKMLMIKETTYRNITSITQKKFERHNVGISSHEGMERFLVASSKFQKKYNDIELYATDGSVNDLIKKLSVGQFALIIVAVDSLDKIECEYRMLNKEEILLVAPKNHNSKLLDNNNIAWDYLRTQNFILSKKDSTMRAISDNIFLQKQFKPNIICELNNVPATLRMVGDGSGYAFLSSGLKTDSDYLNFYSLTPQIYRYQVVIYSNLYNNNSKMMEFIEML